MRLVADGDHPWVGGRDLTVLELVAADVVDDVLLHVRGSRALAVQRTDDVSLKIEKEIL